MSIAVFVASLALGAGISWMNNRPGWDDTGVTALALFVVFVLAFPLAGALLAALVSRKTTSGVVS